MSIEDQIGNKRKIWSHRIFGHSHGFAYRDCECELNLVFNHVVKDIDA